MHAHVQAPAADPHNVAERTERLFGHSGLGWGLNVRGYLRRSDAKAVRLVCKKWRETVDSRWTWRREVHWSDGFNIHDRDQPLDSVGPGSSMRMHARDIDQPLDSVGPRPWPSIHNQPQALDLQSVGPWSGYSSDDDEFEDDSFVVEDVEAAVHSGSRAATASSPWNFDCNS
jgi:hypothetical protein